MGELVIAARKIKAYGRGVPPERPIPDLPMEEPNFDLLFGPPKSANPLQAKNTAGPLKGSYDKVDLSDEVQVTDKMTITWVSLVFAC